MKLCSKCKKNKPPVAFSKHVKWDQGLHAWCKDCSKAAAKAYYYANTAKCLARCRAWELANPQKAKGIDLKRRYGMSVEEWDALFREQGGVCAICKEKTRRLCVDHCHTTKKVRGLLCQNCNASMGMLKESVESLKNAIKYLTKHKT